ncbi:MAG: WG repeat-containing protein [Bacteroidota bacterium]
MRYLFLILIASCPFVLFSQKKIINEGQVALLVNGNYTVNNHYYADKALLDRINLMDEQIKSLLQRVERTEKKTKKIEKKQSKDNDSLQAKYLLLQSSMLKLQTTNSNILDSISVLKGIFNDYKALADSIKTQKNEVSDTLYKDVVVTEMVFDGIQQLRNDFSSQTDSENREAFPLDLIYRNSKYVVIGEYADNGLATFKDGHKYGYTDRWFNDDVIKPEYDFADKFRYGIALVKRNDYTDPFYIDKNNNNVFGREYKCATGFFKEFGYVKIFGKSLFKYKRAYIYDTKGWYLLSKSGKLSSFDRRKLDSNPSEQLDSIVYNEKHKVFIAKAKNNKRILLDIQFNEIYMADWIHEFDSIGHFYSITNGWHAIKNRDGSNFIGPSKRPINFDKYKIAIVEEQDSMRLIDIRGKIHYSALELYNGSEGIYPFKLGDSLYNYFVLSRGIVLDGKYSQVDSFHRGLAVVRYTVTKKFGVINQRAQWRIEPVFNSITYNKSDKTFNCIHEGKIFVFDSEGKCVSNCINYKELLEKYNIKK